MRGEEKENWLIDFFCVLVVAAGLPSLMLGFLAAMPKDNVFVRGGNTMPPPQHCRRRRRSRFQGHSVEEEMAKNRCFRLEEFEEKLNCALIYMVLITLLPALLMKATFQNPSPFF